MTEGSDRRGFFKEFLRAAADVTREVGSVAKDLGSALQTGDEGGELDDATDWDPVRPVPALPTQTPASTEDLLALCREVGLEARADDVRRLARRSFRLTRGERSADDVGASRLGGAPDLPPALEWPVRDGEALAFLGQLRLQDVAALDSSTTLSPSGLLLFFFDASRQPSGLAPDDAGSCRVILVEDESAAAPAEPGQGAFSDYPLHLSSELSVPPGWSSYVEMLELTEEEALAWDELREQLAAKQGVELEDLSPDQHALHRLLGFPDTASDELELDCQLASEGLDLRDGEGYFDPRRDELAPGAAAWRLLLQVSSDDDLGTEWDEGLSRLYIFVRESDLATRDFTRPWAILR